MAERIVLLGGSFDPVHRGHTTVAHAVAEQCGFDRITLVPAAISPHKRQAHASVADRLAMLRLATTAEDLFEICELEVHRSGPSYTIDTLAALRAQAGGEAELYWIIGADMLEDLPNWHRAPDVVEAATLVIAARPPWHERLDATFEMLGDHFTDSQVRGLRQWTLQTPLIDVSSTQVRAAAAAGQPGDHLVAPAVADYIAQHGLYRGPTGQ